MCKPRFLRAALVALLAVAPLAQVKAQSAAAQPDDSTTSSSTKVDFAKQILPILSDKCFVCHGPDSDDQSDLRLDSLEAATTDLGGYKAIDPEAPAQSELLSRIFSEDDPMPPEGAEKQLTEDERALLKRWIESGGQYATHWAFVPPQKQPGLPSDVSAIDWYIEHGLREAKVSFAPEADKSVLARRVALVLTGLPPTAEQLATFLQDDSEGAYERLVDSLLESARFGEHQARYWLDAVRYGDTHGLHLDNRRGIYPYRDWVVGALNQNLPLDKFITWQIAGDLMPNPTLAQRVATGYVRLNPSTGEGGAIPAEFQMKNNFDRVETLGTVFLGLSLTCARCHTHKYDPIPQSEYYQLLAFFNNTAEPALDGNSYTYGPTVNVPDGQAAWMRWNEMEQRRDALLDEASVRVGDGNAHVEFSRARSKWRTFNWRISQPYDSSASPSDQWQKAVGLPGTISGKQARNKLPGKDQSVSIAFQAKVGTDQHLQLTLSGAAGTAVYVDGKPEPLVTKDNHEPRLTVPISLSEGQHNLEVRVVGFGGMAQLELQVSNPWDALAKTGDWAKCDRNDQMAMIADAAGPFGSGDLQVRAAQLSREITEAQNSFTTTLVARELAKPRQTRMLNRGEYDLPVGEPLTPGILSVLGDLPDDAPRNRLGLAAWLTSSENPLVSRVLVNRIWQRTFGFGLVRTPEDFGLQGMQPTHPELLDWLAVELQENGWNLKQLLRQMVTSRTFRQSSVWRRDIDDPENHLYARASSYRLDAEVLRDIGLLTSGLLDDHMGGEGFRPYQPAGMWMALAHPASNTKKYVRDEGQQVYRRSLYVYWKRTSPHPMMTLFDAPDRESSCVRRSRTNTPLQSLGLLNEIQRIEMARSLAQRLIKTHSDDEARINQLYQWIACRNANDRELGVVQSLIEFMTGRYQGSRDDASALLAVGDAPVDSDLEPTEVAAWTQVCCTLLASDAALLLY